MAAPLRWGICGAGMISSDFAYALATLPDHHKIQAVAATCPERGKTFAEKHDISVVYSNYAALFADKNVDAVYIGCVTSCHEDAVLSALEAGKHVLCEKPLAPNAKVARRMIQKAQETGLFLMEAYWTRFFPAMVKAREQLKSGVIGEQLLFHGNFCYPLTGNITHLKNAGGATNTLGAYFPMLASYLFFPNCEPEKPQQILACAKIGDSGVDETISVTLCYSNGRIADYVSSIVTVSPQNAFICGSKGTIQIPSHVWCPTTLVTPAETFYFSLPESNAPFSFPNSVGLLYEAEHVRECLQKGYKESPVMPLRETLMLAEINDEIRRQLGIVFPQD